MPNALDKFHAAYGAVLKNSMPKLRKRDKKKEKERADRIAAAKKRIMDPVIIEGSKRQNSYNHVELVIITSNRVFANLVHIKIELPVNLASPLS